jgi:hypothetical protein
MRKRFSHPLVTILINCEAADDMAVHYESGFRSAGRREVIRPLANRPRKYRPNRQKL